MSTMRAIVQDRYGHAEVLHLAAVNKPEIADNQVLVGVQAAGVDRGVAHVMTGTPYLIRLAGYGIRRPKKPIRGMELAGRVEAVGAAVTRFKPGDEVIGAGDGSFAEYVAVREDRLARKPVNVSMEAAAAVAVSATTALQALRDQGKVQAGQKVLVIGASGGVGTFAVQLAKAFGAEVTGVCSTSKVELVRSLGADHVIDYTREDFVAGGRQYDVILDIGGNRPLSEIRRALRREGTLVIVGGEGGGKWIGETVAQELKALPAAPFRRQKLRVFVAKPNADDLETLSELIEAGKLKPIVDRVFPLSQAANAVRYLEEGRVRGKVVIRVL